MSLLEQPVSKVRQILIGDKQPKKKGLVPTAVSGIGTDAAIRIVDNFIGSPMQKFASINIPFIGPVGVIDALNFLVNGGPRNIKGGLTAVIGARIAIGTITNLGPIKFPSVVNQASTNSTPSASGQSGGLPI